MPVIKADPLPRAKPGSFGARVREMRQELGRLADAQRYTLRAFAQASRLSPVALTRIETGQLLPDRETTIRIAEALSVNANGLLALAGHDPLTQTEERQKP